MRASFKIIYTSATCSCIGLLLVVLLAMLQLNEAKPSPWWNNNEANYDASLDPLVWSRAFVQDTVRKPRISQNYEYNPPQLSLELLGKRRRQQQHSSFNNWWRHKPKKPQQSGNNKYKKYLRRRRKLLLQTRC